MKALKTTLVALFICALAAPAAAQDMANEDWLDKGFAFGIGAGPGIGATFGLACPGADGGGAFTGCPSGTPIGLSARMFPVEQFGIEINFSMGSSSFSTETEPNLNNTLGDPRHVLGRVRALHFALIPEFRFLTSNRASLSGYAGIGITNTRARTDVLSSFQQAGAPPIYTEVSDSITSIGLSFGLRGEVFLYKFFSIHGRVGINYDPASDAEQEGFDLRPDPTTAAEAEARAQEEAARDAVKLRGANVSIFDQATLLGSFGFTVWFN